MRGFCVCAKRSFTQHAILGEGRMQLLAQPKLNPEPQEPQSFTLPLAGGIYYIYYSPLLLLLLA